MNVFLVIPTLKQGGAERVISEIANELCNRSDIEVHLILLAKSDDFYKIDNRVVLHRLEFTNNGHVKKIIAELVIFLKLRYLLKKYEPKVVLSFMDKYNVFTILASSFLGVRVFISDRSNPKLPQSLYLRSIKKLTYRHATGIIAQTSLAKDIIESFSRNKNIKVIPNPVKEVQLYPQIPREKIIINIGRMVPEKGQDFLLQAFAKLEARDWKLVILGDGPLRNNLQSNVVKLGLTDTVIMPGAVKDVDKWLAKSSIFVLSSISEGFPNSLMEAMAAGLPCISFDCDAGPRDIIKNEVNGLLVDEGNINELVDKLNSLIIDTELAKKIAENALLVRRKYHIQSIGKRYLDFLLNE